MYPPIAFFDIIRILSFSNSTNPVFISFCPYMKDREKKSGEEKENDEV